MRKSEINRSVAWLSSMAAALIIAGCAGPQTVPPSDTLAGSTPPAAPAPMAGAPAADAAPDRDAAPAAPATAPAVSRYVVKRGDTLSSIASANGCTVNDLRGWNRLGRRGKLAIGQVLRIAPRAAAQAGAAPAAANPPSESAVPAAQTQADSTSDRQVAKETKRHAQRVVLAWPAKGAIVEMFEPGRNRGIQIAGRAGDPVRAAASGRVMYAGAGLNGYGTLILVQHNADFLTAYAHNRKLLVKTGDIVQQGDAIAEMGDVDNARVAVLFEVRRDGKPVNPLPYLPNRQG
ncbi:peptidoglycan DD-metalloendopeptidase family protein [Burkholderia alba]|uniref:peptidoglycan DD-metalloendopeptidase family protein n=1 Tax=Burkholderia alba TaxID=2683677 RepID=UPI002B0546CC|nr:peptidoglycan DD-metalloendopeptidase family protein [Burkholderia alba]